MPFGFSFGKSTVGEVIAIDFGVSSLKVLQASQGDAPKLQAIACAATPDELSEKHAERLAFQAQALPELLKQGGFKGKRAVCTLSACHSLVQHVQIPKTDGANRAALLNEQLRKVTGRDPSGLILRTFDVCDVTRSGKKCEEVLCVALPRDVVLAHVRALQNAKLEAVGVHCEQLASVRAFDRITRRAGDSALTSLYIDLGYGTTKVMIVHGRELVFGKTIQVAGRQLDRAFARAHKSTTAKVRRTGAPLVATPMTQQVRQANAALDDTAALTAKLVHESQARNGAGAPAPGPALTAGSPAPEASAPATAVADGEERRTGNTPSMLCELGESAADEPSPEAAITSVLDALADEVAMCVRYHGALFPDRKIDRFVFAGGEARQLEIARRVSKALRCQAHFADPFAHLDRAGVRAVGVDLSSPQPGWIVPLGLSVAPTDL